MRGRPVRRSLDPVVRTLLGPLLDAAPTSDGWRVLSWDAEQGVSLTLGKPGHAILIELEQRDEERLCYARTARFNVNARHLFSAARAMSEHERQLVDLVVRVVGRREAKLPAVERTTTGRRTAVREVLVERALISEGEGHYYFNPYVGCIIGCPFCYVAQRADLSRGLEGLPSLPWGRWVDVKVNAPEVLRREVRQNPPGLVRMSPVLTDPYQPTERNYRVTRRSLEVLLDAGFTPTILTRAPRVLDDLELLRSFPRAAVGFSIPTDDDSVRRQFEPGADPVEERLDALQRCHAAGLRTFGAVQPMLPMNPERLAAAMAPYVYAVRIDRMYELPRLLPLYEAAGLADAAGNDFFERTGRALREAFGRLGVRVDDLDDLADLLGG